MPKGLGSDYFTQSLRIAALCHTCNDAISAYCFAGVLISDKSLVRVKPKLNRKGSDSFEEGRWASSPADTKEVTGGSML